MGLVCVCNSSILSEEGLTFETPALKLFTVANLHYKLTQLKKPNHLVLLPIIWFWDGKFWISRFWQVITCTRAPNCNAAPQGFRQQQNSNLIFAEFIRCVKRDSTAVTGNPYSIKIAIPPTFTLILALRNLHYTKSFQLIDIFPSPNGPFCFKM